MGSVWVSENEGEKVWEKLERVREVGEDGDGVILLMEKEEVELYGCGNGRSGGRGGGVCWPKGPSL